MRSRSIGIISVIDGCKTREKIPLKVVSSLTGWEYIIRPTYAGKVYFQNKKQEIAKYRRHLAFEWGKFLVSVLISIAALIVAIIK